LRRRVPATGTRDVHPLAVCGMPDACLAAVSGRCLEASTLKASKGRARTWCESSRSVAHFCRTTRPLRGNQLGAGHSPDARGPSNCNPVAHSQRSAQAQSGGCTARRPQSRVAIAGRERRRQIDRHAYSFCAPRASSGCASASNGVPPPGERWANPRAKLALQESDPV
jgi:hypothetical protein